MTTTYQLLLTSYVRANRYLTNCITDYLITDYLLFPEVLHVITGCFIESQTVKFAVGSDSG